MERYPEHRFVASQAQQFKWLEQVHRHMLRSSCISMLILYTPPAVPSSIRPCQSKDPIRTISYDWRVLGRERHEHAFG